MLHVLEAIGGGTARHLVDLVKHVPGVEHETVTPLRRLDGLSDDGALEELRSAGALVHVVAMRRNPLHPTNLRAILSIRRLIRSGRFDIVHGHSSVGGAIARLAAAGTGCVRVYTPHALAEGGLAIGTERMLRPLTDQLIAVSPSEGELALQRRLISRTRLSIVRNGMEGELPAPVIDLRTMLGLGPSTPLVGTVCRLVPQKEPETFVRACLEVAGQRSDVHFVLIGDGPLRSAVTAVIGRAAEGARIHHLPDLEKPAWAVGQLDVFCLASRFEGGPYTPLEAMRARVPVVVSDAVGSRDAVEHGTSGLVVPVGDSAALARAVLGLLDDRRLAARLAKAGHSRFKQLFGVEEMGRLTAEVYMRLVSPAEHLVDGGARPKVPAP